MTRNRIVSTVVVVATCALSALAQEAGEHQLYIVYPERGGSPESSEAETERLKLANDWVRRFFAKAEVAARFALVDNREKADIVLFLRQTTDSSIVGIPPSASTTTLSDGLVIGAECSGKDCWTFEGHTDYASNWVLSLYRAGDFGGYDPALPSNMQSESPSPGARPIVQVDEKQARVELCKGGFSVRSPRQYELEIGCDVLEFWNQMQRRENKPELLSTDVFSPSEGIVPNQPLLQNAARPSALPSPQESTFTLEGKVTEVVKGKLTVSTEENIIFHVDVDDKTDIKRDDGSPGSAKDLHAGIPVKVAGNQEESGEIKALKIEIEPKSASTDR